MLLFYKHYKQKFPPSPIYDDSQFRFFMNTPSIKTPPQLRSEEYVRKLCPRGKSLVRNLWKSNKSEISYA